MLDQSPKTTPTLFTSSDPTKVDTILDLDKQGISTLIKQSIQSTAHEEDALSNGIMSKFPSFLNDKQALNGNKEGDEERNKEGDEERNKEGDEERNKQIDGQMDLAKNYTNKAEEIIGELQKSIDQGESISNTISQLKNYIAMTKYYIEYIESLQKQQEFQQFQKEMLSSLQHPHAA